MTAKDNVRLAAGLAMALALALAACRGRERPVPDGNAPSPESSTRRVILCVGTSLTAGQGLDPEQAYPALLQAKVDAAGLSYRVVNAGISGETSAGALRRMDWLLRQKIAVLVLETGANDGLRGQDPESTRANIQAVFDRARQLSPPPRLVLAGMEALPNYGPEYSRKFRALYPELASRNVAALVPFILEGVAGVPTLNQADGIHPTAAGHERVAENVWRILRPLLQD
jgi:acyl-CoA thioesterase-1